MAYCQLLCHSRQSLAIYSRLDQRIYTKLEYTGELEWFPLNHLLIEPEVWAYAVEQKGYDPKVVFCHPGILKYDTRTALYYRGLCGLSLKSAQDYVGALGALEAGNPRARMTDEKALKMARVYNTFICSIIQNSIDWTLENGNRTIVATLGITLDGVMRNKIGNVAEERIRTLLVEWLLDQGLVQSPAITKEEIYQELPQICILSDGTQMQFGSEPDVAFTRDGRLLATVEIKGGIDPAGALERYGAATKSFRHAIINNPQCRNFYLTAVSTDELDRRIRADRLVERSFSIIEILDEPLIRKEFLNELFHHTLRVI